MKKKTRNNLDEMQEQKMLKIEHNACWLAFWGLLAVCAVQALIYEREDFRYITGEWLVLLCMGLYISIDCARNGIWDRKLAPTPAVNGWGSLIAGIAVAVFNFVISYKQYGALAGAVAAGVFMGTLTAGICFLALTGMTYIYKKRVKKLEGVGSDEDEESENNEN